MNELGSEAEDQAIEVGAEETFRKVSRPISRGIATALVSLSAEKLLEYSIVAVLIVVTAGGFVLYVVVKKKRAKQVRQSKGIKIKTVHKY